MVSSLDGFIAKKNGDVSWLKSTDTYEKGVLLTEEDINAYLRNIDCYVMGSRTYAHALELGWPYGEKPVIVLTTRKLMAEQRNVAFYSGDLRQLIHQQLQPNYKNIWIVGGASLARKFLQMKLIDEIIIAIMPILLGSGISFFDDLGQASALHLNDVIAYRDGMVELCYRVKKQ